VEIPIELARRVQRRPVISVLESSRLTRGKERFTFKGPRRRDAHTHTLAHVEDRVRITCTYHRIASEILVNLGVLSARQIDSFFNFANVFREESRVDAQRDYTDLYSPRNYASHLRRSVFVCRAQRQPSNVIGVNFRFPQFPRFPRRSPPAFFDRAHKTPPSERFISPGICPCAVLYFRKFIQRCILPAVLHLSRCNAIPSKINEARSRCFFRTEEKEGEP